MGDAKRRREAGTMTATVRLPPLSMDELQLIHDMMHRRLHELHGAGEGPDEAAKGEFEALRALHHKIFAH
jgi:hypothetical protein